MRTFNSIGIGICAVVLLGAVASACGGGGETQTTTSTSSTTGSSTSTGNTGGGGSGGTTTTSSSSTTTTSGSTGGGGSGGSQPGSHGPGASQLVNGGDTVKSPSYRMVFTLGQPTQNQTKTTSPSYRLQGGLIGATGTSP